MVIKGGARGGAAGLAAHLQRLDTNERAEVKQLRGVAAQDLDGALLEMEAVAMGSRSQRHFYHASINTRADEAMTPEQWAKAVDRLEQELGLDDQPRAVVFHLKEGRAHVHVVWSRIDLDKMTAISDSHNFRRHEIVARELEREFGHARVQGVHVERDGQPRPDRTPSHAEMQQAERNRVTPEQATAKLTALWQQTDSGKTFAAALAEEGWSLARGDRRDFVAVDPQGGIHSLSRRIEGITAKDVRARMSDVDAASLPSVDDAREAQAVRHHEQFGLSPDYPADAETGKRHNPAIATSDGGMVAQQMEALRRFKSNSAELNQRREDEPPAGREAAPPPDEKPDKALDADERQRRFKEQLDRNFSRNDPGDRSR